MLTSSSIVKFLQTAKKSVSVLFIKRNITVICSQVNYLPPKLSGCSHLFANKYQNIYIFNNIKFILCFNPFSTITSKDIHNLADNIFEEYPDWVKSFKKEELIKILEFFASYGCSTVELKKNCLKYLSPTNSSYIKAKHIAELDSDVISLMPFMALSLVSLRKAAKRARDDKNEIVGFPNRISYLLHHLETPMNELIPVLIKHPSLLTMKFKRLHHKMIVLKNAGILSKDLVKDLWIFNYNEEMLINRITRAETAGAKLKPWMLRCSEKTFTSMLTKYCQTQNILGGNDVVRYLSEKLHCSPKYVEFMMERNKALKSVNIPKVDEILNFLYENGYTSQEIRLFPRVFCTKVLTLKRRMEEYKQVRSTLPSIPQLCVSSNNSWRKITKQTST